MIYIHVQLRGRPFDSEGGGAWHFLEINILTLKMLEINNLSSSGKKINNLTLINLLEFRGKVQNFPKNFPLASLATVQFLQFSGSLRSHSIITCLPRDSSISNFSGSLRSHLIITWMFDFMYYTSLFIITIFLPLLLFRYILVHVPIIIA